MTTLSPAATAFVTERHLATLSSVRPDGSPHVVPVGFTWDADTGLARIITSGTSYKARLAARGGPVAVCQVDGRHWLTLGGPVTVSDDPARVAEAVARYASRYRPPRENPARVVLEITVETVLASASMRA
ncbi:pyridoxamine 5'-phosphate oxidase family protein [Jatrophihabitans sp. YIM 134969]